MGAEILRKTNQKRLPAVEEHNNQNEKFIQQSIFSGQIISKLKNTSKGNMQFGKPKYKRVKKIKILRPIGHHHIYQYMFNRTQGKDRKQQKTLKK